MPLGTFSHACQEDLVVKSGIRDVPYFNAPIYLENIEQVPVDARYYKSSAQRAMFRSERLTKFSAESTIITSR